jgi:ubiquinone/menaquinone biosynthesis C-methylase UbiE
MLKMYHRNPHSGDTPNFWANSWDEISFEEALGQCSEDPLRPLFEKYIQADSLILEGGCGKGHWVAYFKDRGYKIVGLDFAQRTLVELKGRRAGLSLCAGNVNALPFADDIFDIYYSGGVVEHFESGCEAALAEARRVIKKEGTLLLSVPFFSPLRRSLLPFRRGEWRKVDAPQADGSHSDEQLKYFQYAYSPLEFNRMLHEAGLETVETMGYSIMWGLYDLKFLSERAKRKIERRLENTIEEKRTVAPGPQTETTAASSLKRLLIGERRDTLLQKAFTGLMRLTTANMMMFVCKKK